MEIIDDFDRWTLAPFVLFEIVDPRPSRYWVATQLDDPAAMALWPQSFSQTYYHDDLTEGSPDVVADFKSCEL
ncbi:MAG TPA: hypothetical protein VN493_14355 [Thermoanaerobaculia bacterium]|nr:hypothetical protein [Thermoanaerobaculia bacterium]